MGFSMQQANKYEQQCGVILGSLTGLGFWHAGRKGEGVGGWGYPVEIRQAFQ